MRRPRILVTEPEYFTPRSLARMRAVATVDARRLSPGELARTVGRYDALVVRIETKVDADVLEQAKRLKCVVTATTGLNHIDLRKLKALEIPLFSLKGEHSVPTAEHALALLMACARNIPWAHQEMLRGGWRRWHYVGSELRGKTLGIFGIGRIGTEMSRRARALGLQVLAYDPYLSKAQVRSRGARKVNWSGFLSSCDFFSLHAPLTLETSGRFGAREFSKMKSSAILVNTARGAILDEKAFLNALSKGKIRAAAVDVYPEEPLAPASSLRRYARSRRNLILTPHLGGSTFEAKERASMQAAEFVTEFFGAMSRSGV